MASQLSLRSPFPAYSTHTKKILKFWIPKKLDVITLKSESCGFTTVICPKDADGMANSVDPDQTAPLGAVWSGSTLFDLGLHCLLRCVCPKTLEHYGTHIFNPYDIKLKFQHILCPVSSPSSVCWLLVN